MIGPKHPQVELLARRLRLRTLRRDLRADSSDPQNLSPAALKAVLHFSCGLANIFDQLSYGEARLVNTSWGRPGKLTNDGGKGDTVIRNFGPTSHSERRL